MLDYIPDFKGTTGIEDFFHMYKENFNNIWKINPDDYTKLMNALYENFISTIEGYVDNFLTTLRFIPWMSIFHNSSDYREDKMCTLEMQQDKLCILSCSRDTAEEFERYKEDLNNIIRKAISSINQEVPGFFDESKSEEQLADDLVDMDVYDYIKRKEAMLSNEE